MKWIARLQQSLGLWMGIAVMAGGSAAAQLLIIVSSPIVARLYTPADFGVTAAYSFMLTGALAINSLRYEYAIPLPKEDDEAANITGMTMALVLVLSLVMTAVIWGIGDTISIWLNEPRLKELLPLLPFGLIIGGWLMALNYWTVRRKDFRTVTAAQLSTSTGQVAGQIGFGLLGVGVIGLGISFVVGQVLALLAYVRVHFPWGALRPASWGALMVKYKKFPLYSTFSSLVDIIGSQFPAVLFLAFFSAAEAGFFALTIRILSLPLGVISNAVAQGFYPALAEVQDDRLKTMRLFESMASALFLISLTGFGFILATGNHLFRIVFGEQWATAGVYAQLLVPYFLVVFISSPLSSLSLVQGRQKEVLWLISAVTVLRFGALIVGALLQSALISVGLFALVSFIIFLVYLVWLLHLAGLKLHTWLRPHVGFVGLFAALVVCGLWTGSFVPPITHVLIFTCAFGLFGLLCLHRLRQTMPRTAYPAASGGANGNH
jgi:O-antigen/teichoic acid export membrane protein